MYGNSGLYSLALGNSGQTSFDSGNRLLFCLNGIAGYQEDVTSVVNQFSLCLDAEQHKKISQYVEDELHARTIGNDFYKTQVVIPLQIHLLVMIF